MKRIRRLFQKYRDVLSYLFFGVLTTAVNLLVYQLLLSVAGVPNVPATVLAWLAAVVFAFVTNKWFVFRSRSVRVRILLKEAASFFGFRLITGGMDVAIMAVAVDLLHGHPTLWKVISNFIVILVNYLASQWVVFRKKR